MEKSKLKDSESEIIIMKYMNEIAKYCYIFRSRIEQPVIKYHF